MSKRGAHEEFWAGEFGDEYTSRNEGPSVLSSNAVLFAEALRRVETLGSLLEIGANRGLNLRALRTIRPAIDLWGLEINASAARELERLLGNDRVVVSSMFEFAPDRQWDMVVTKGVLIHISPELLPTAYDLIASLSRRYVLIAEYYNPTPISVEYRGFADRLFKRDFAGEFMDRHSQFRLVDYGFVYHRDVHAPQDDLTWFVLEDRSGVSC